MSFENLIPPSAPEIEEVILGNFMMNRKLWLNYSPLLLPEYFYVSFHQQIFEYMCSSGVTDFQIIAEKYADRAADIACMAENYSSALDLKEEIELLKDKFERRRLIEICTHSMTAAAEDYEQTSMEITDNTLSQINSNYMPTGKPELLNQIAPRIISQFEQQPTGEGIGYKTGLADVDRILGGICDGEFCIVAGRPSMGKTSFALQMIRHNAVVHKIPTLFFSLEMSRDAIAGRILWAEAQANYETVLRGGKQDLPAVREKYETDLCNTPLYLDGTPGTTISHIQIKTENYVRNYGVKIIFIDRLEYIRPTIRGRSRNEEVSEISKGLVYIAKKFNIPVILVVQLNRGVEHREDKIPELSDLRDSGALEEDAVKVLMIYREEYYKRESQKKSIAEILIRKNQNGRTGYCETIFKAETMSFFNLTPEHTMGGEYNP